VGNPDCGGFCELGLAGTNVGLDLGHGSFFDD